MTNTLLHHLVPLGGLAALFVARLFFKVIRLAVLLVVVGIVVLSLMHPHEWQALARLVGLR